MQVVHVCWTGGALRFWGEDGDRARTVRSVQPGGGAGTDPQTTSAGLSPDTDPTTAHAEPAPESATACATFPHTAALSAGASRPAATSTGAAAQAVPHPYALSRDELLALLDVIEVEDDRSEISEIRLGLSADDVSPITLRLPADDLGPLPSERLSASLGFEDAELPVRLAPLEVDAVRIPGEKALPLLLQLAGRSDHERPPFGRALRYWCAVAAFVAELLRDQRFVPTLVQERSGILRAGWHPWLRDASASRRAALLRDAMPGAVRAVVDEHRHDAGRILEDALDVLTDAAVRVVLHEQDFADAIADRVPEEDPHVAWLSGLLDGQERVPAPPGMELTLLRGARSWIAQLDDTGEGRPYRLGLRLSEPEANDTAPADPARDAATVKWRLSLHLVPPGSDAEWISAEEIWSAPETTLEGSAAGRQELLLAELGRASRMYTALERAMASPHPTGLDLSTEQAYEFLRTHRGILSESGFLIDAPSWWDQPASRLGVRLVIDSKPIEPGGAWDPGRTDLGLHSLVNYRWQISLGQQPLTIEQFRALAAAGVPLVRVGGQWVEIREQDLAGALRFLDEHPGGEMTVLEAMRLAHGAADEPKGLPVNGLVASGWVGELFGTDSSLERLESIPAPAQFRGSLRPYQLSGLSWLAFLDRFGLGACLADDMGLGKTIQLIALLLAERERSEEAVGPTLLVAPMSVISNWERELHRFAPELRVHVHHGLDRPVGERFVQLANTCDVVVTTYALVVRDRESLHRVEWRRVCLDEAQHIKNPPTKQTAAIRSLKSRHRVALTGTPVENRLSELWSIMEFLNPGYLGSSGDFRRRFAIPIERHRDRRQAERLRDLVRPFILRRLKTDPTVISDLPPLVETKHVTPLTTEQTALYEQVVSDMLVRVDRAEGMQRRGLILSALVKLKQVCNHPAHLLKEDGVTATMGEHAIAPLASRSGKARRLMEMLEELVAAGDRALIFTQYRQMGHLLVAMIRHHLDTEPLFLHGGTPAGRRQQLIDRFQSEDASVPIFILSLKAGGVGLNLTAANHVFHYDRWWNPAVENQATDRAFRIGQTRTVHVHKLITAGTLEERIDQMIEQKTELAERIIGAGEAWLTELSTGQLRDLFSLRQSSLATDDQLDEEDEAA